MMSIWSAQRRGLFFLIALIGFCSGSCTKNTPKSTDYKTATISYILANGTNTTLFESIIQKADLDTIFNGSGPFTVFVPTNDALSQAGINESIISNYTVADAKNMVLYHTIAGTSLAAESFIGTRESKEIMANGDSVFISGDSSTIYVNGIAVTTVDLVAANGILHALQGVLRSPDKNLLELVNTDTALTFLSTAMLRATGMPDSVTSRLALGGPYTFFAPDNDAFRALGYTAAQDLNSANPDSMRLLILSHLVPQRLFNYDIPDSSTLQTVNDSTLYFNLTGINAQVQIKGHDTFANLVGVNIMAKNGVLFKVDEAFIH
jgi:uncharacterized surface protein with fasciclin (FAS1) repeats